MPNNPILLQWDSAVKSNPRVCAAVHEGIAAIGAILPRMINLIHERPLGRGRTVDQHLDAAIYGPGRIEHDILQASRQRDEWRAEAGFPYTDLLVTNRDIVVESWLSACPYVLGFAGMGVAMVSVHRMRAASTPAAGLKVIALVTAHELGHSYGVVPASARRHDSRGGVYHGHCTNPACTMRQFGTVPEAETLLRDMGGRILFCADCTRDLNSLRGQTFSAGRKTFGVTF